MIETKRKEKKKKKKNYSGKKCETAQSLKHTKITEENEKIRMRAVKLKAWTANQFILYTHCNAINDNSELFWVCMWMNEWMCMCWCVCVLFGKAYCVCMYCGDTCWRWQIRSQLFFLNAQYIINLFVFVYKLLCLVSVILDLYGQKKIEKKTVFYHSFFWVQFGSIRFVCVV